MWILLPLSMAAIWRAQFEILFTDRNPVPGKKEEAS